MNKRSQPVWVMPPGIERSDLYLFNSLTRKKVKFTPRHGNNVTWYSCGPTVYDASHMGHARSYISFDILRRILSEYFGYKILYVMNITDIDDKIIRRARQNYLYEKYISENKSLEDTVCDAQQVMAAYETTIRLIHDPDKKVMMERMLTNVSSAVESLKNAIKSKDDDSITLAKNNLLNSAKDPLSDWLDRQYGSAIKENSIFASLPRYWENEFHKDMKALNVLPPDVLTRVSDYIPQIIAFIEKVVENGFAYESNGSVYFNVSEFHKKDKHYYAKLVPEAYGDTNSLQEGEGDLSDEISDKQSPNDFALWKKSKSGEPSWPSPWGDGRPGWHIECSAMASEVCGPNLDIHTGGVDLKFPHHDNELAQSEAYFDSSSWVNYFLHTGHLTISGCKMSKSLKNFITIQEALKKNTATQLRLAFLLHSWKDTLDYSHNTMEMAVQLEKTFNEFFLTVKDAVRCGVGAGEGGPWEKEEAELFKKLIEVQEDVHKALCDNIDTRMALESMRNLVGATHVYLQRKPLNPSSTLLDRVGRWVTEILHIFGTIAGPRGGIGFPMGGEEISNKEETVLPYLEVLASFRQNVRTAIRGGDGIDGKQAVLKLCDQLRDDVLPELGVRLEDKEGRSVVKLVCKEQLLKEREEKKFIEAEKERKKQEQFAAQKLKEDQKKISPEEMFRIEADKYSKFDEKGCPTHDHQGQELSKGLIKKLQKLQLAQEKKYKEYLATMKS